MRISFDENGFKIRKVSRCRPTVSNEPTLTTKQEFFFEKVAPVQSITDIVLLGFWLILLPGMFISSYTTICFLAKNFFSSNVYISVNTIFKCFYLSFSCEIGHPLSMYVTRGMEGVNPNCIQVLTEGEGYHASRVIIPLRYYALTLSLFMFLSYGVLFYL